MIRPDIRVEGLNEIRRAARAIEPALAGEIRDANLRAATVVADAARPRVPMRSGAARSSVRAGGGQSSAVVRAGGAKAPHFPWLDFGGRIAPRGTPITRPAAPAGRYLYPALADHTDDVLHAYQQGMARVLGRLGLA